MALKLCFMDWETQGPDLTITGSMNYVLDPSTRPLILSYAAEEGEVMLWHNLSLRTELVPEVYDFINNAFPQGAQTSKGAPEYMWDVAGNSEGYFIAWNMGFDRSVFQQIATPELGFPKVSIEQTLDAMAQGQASSLPGSLDMAGRALGLGNKTSGGKAVMKRFADPDAPMPGSPEHVASKGDYAKGVKDAINMWGIYIDYALQDTALMRDIWYACRQLDAGEWEEYWVSERINDRGIGVDLDVCRGASAYREEELAHVAEECARITKGEINSPTLTKKINEWLYQRLPDDLAEHMVKARDEDGNVTRLTGSKQVITNLLEEMKVSEAAPADDVLDLVELLQFGRSSSAIKFEKMAAQAVDGRLCGSYVFNGAGQTGRYCLAEGSPIKVLTPEGAIEDKPIERVGIKDKVWDGNEWVSHEGVVFSGVKGVITYDGVCATPLHKVYVGERDFLTLQQAKDSGISLYKGGSPCTQYTR